MRKGFLNAVGGLLFAATSVLFAQTTVTPEIAKGRDWLSAQVQSDGEVTGTGQSLATAKQVRAEVLDTLWRLDRKPESLATKVALEGNDTEVEHLARSLVAAARAGKSISHILVELRGFQNADGGFGGQRGKGSSILDTSLALIAFRSAGITEGSELSRSVDFLSQSLGGNGSASWSSGERSAPYLEAYRLLALQTYSNVFSISNSAALAKQRLLGYRQNNHYVEVLLDAVGAIALGFGTTSDGELISLRAALLEKQLADGSWEHDPFVTALALRGLGAGASAPLPTAGRITAKIRDRANLAPLAGAVMTLAGGAAPFDASSGGDGVIEISNIPPGTYQVTIQKTGYSGTVPVDITVNAGQTINFGNVDLNRLATQAVIAGQVTDVATTNPLAGATIVLTGAVTATITTSPDGHYEYVTDITGDVQIAVSKSGYQSVQAMGTLVADSILRFSPALYPEGMGVPNVANMIGQVINASTGLAIPGATVQAGQRTTTTGTDGRFALIELQLGLSNIEVSKVGYNTQSFTGTLVAGVNDLGQVRLIAVVDGQKSSIFGVVRDDLNSTPVPNALVAIEGSTTRALTDAQGNYRIDNITTVPFVAVASAPGYASQRVSAGQNGHGSFNANFALPRMATSNVTLESVAMSAPEYDPYSEVGVMGTVKNNGDSEVGVILSAVVLDQNQNVIRDVPLVERTLATTFEDTIKRIGPGATHVATITWGNLSDAPENYSVLFRGTDAQGQVLIEGSTTYRVRASTKIGGAISTDPPLLQAGTGQTVSITGELINMGNTPIPAGEARLEIKLVAKDDKPVLPKPPRLGAPLITNAQLNSPVGLVRATNGNFYTVSIDRKVIEVSATGNLQVLTTLPANFANTVAVAIHPNGKLRVLTNSKLFEVSLQAPYATSELTVPTANFTSYLIDETGNEYFSGFIDGRAKVIRRSSVGVLTTVVDTGMGTVTRASKGPDGKIYVVSQNEKVVYKIDPVSAALSVAFRGSFPLKAVGFDGAGNMLVAQLISRDNGSLIRPTSETTSTTLVSDLGEVTDLELARDGKIYILSKPGKIQTYDSAGNLRVFAQSFDPSMNELDMAQDGALFSSHGDEVRRVIPGGAAEIVFQAAGVLDVEGINAQNFLVATQNSIVTVNNGVNTTLFQNSQFQPQQVVQSGADVVVAGELFGRVGLYRIENGNAIPIVESPTTQNQLVEMIPENNSQVLVLSKRYLKRILADGRNATLAQFTDAQHMGKRANGEILVHDRVEGFVSVNPQTGFKSSLRPAISNFVFGMTISGNDKVQYVDFISRAVRQFDLTTNANQLLFQLPTGKSPSQQKNAIASQGALTWICDTEGTLYRWDGTALTNFLGKNCFDLAIDENGEIWLRTNADKISKLNADGSQGALLDLADRVFMEQVYFSNAETFALSADSNALQRRNAARQVAQSLSIVNRIFALEAKSDGTIFAFDNSARIYRATEQGFVQISAGSNYRDISIYGDQLFLTKNDGLFLLNVQTGILTRDTWITGWDANALWHLTFQKNGSLRAVANLLSRQVNVFDGNTIVHRLMPIQNPNALKQLADGKWMVSSNARALIEIDEDGDSSTQVEIEKSYQIQDLELDDQRNLIVSYLNENNINYVGKFLANGAIEPLAATSQTAESRLPALVYVAGQIFVFGESGVAYRDDGDGALKAFLAGVSSPGWLAKSGDGKFYVADASNKTISEISPAGGAKLIAFLSQSIGAMCVYNNSKIVFSSSGGFGLSDLNGRWVVNTLAIPSVKGMVCDGNKIFITNSNGNSIQELEFDPVTPEIPVGTVVRSEQLPFGAINLQDKQVLHFSNWEPSVGGEYELTLVPLSQGVDGRLSSGIHVGPGASGNMTSNPSRVANSFALVNVNSDLSGADFTRLSRVEKSQIDLMALNYAFPNSMGADPEGALWYTNNSSRLVRQMIPGVPGEIVPTTLPYVIPRGEIPINALGQAIVVNRLFSGTIPFELRKLSKDGSSTHYVNLNKIPTGMTIDTQDNVFLLETGKIIKVTPGGVTSDYIQLPASFQPYGITRDGVGGIYVQGFANQVLYVSPSLEISSVVEGASFEYEGVNIAGGCDEGIFLSPMGMPGVGQAGEEHTIVQLVGRTGEIGQVLNGRLISDYLLDIDFMVFDRFRNHLLVYSQVSANALYRIPVTCGAIDMDFHVVMATGQDAMSFDPYPSQRVVRGDGKIEYVWNLREVNAQGRPISFDTLLSDLERNEDRPVASEAFLILRNSFQPGDIRIPVNVAKVHVDDLITISVSTDRAEYAQNTAVDMDAVLQNVDNFRKEGELVVQVEDANGGLVEQLIRRNQVFAGNEVLSLDPPFATGSHAPGNYRLLAQIFNGDGQVVAEDDAVFRIIAGNGTGLTLSATLATDKAVYRVGDAAQILSSVSNTTSNQGMSNLLVKERVLAVASGAEIFAGQLPIANLVAGATQTLNFPLSLQGVAAGFYDVLQEVRDANGVLLDSKATRFEVQALIGSDALEGTLSVPSRVRRGTDAVLDAQVRNRGSSDLTGVEIWLDVMDPTLGTRVARYAFTRDIAANFAATLTQSHATAAHNLQNYLAVLRVRLGSDERVLAQKLFVVEDVNLAGNVSAAPVDVRRGAQVIVTALAQNNGNMTASNVVFELVVENATTGTVMARFPYTESMAPTGNLSRAEALDTQSYPAAEYRVRWQALFEDQQISLAQTRFVVRDAMLSGTISVAPSQGEVGTAFEIEALLRNTGNIITEPTPVRIEVRRLDTQVVQTDWQESVVIGAGQSLVLARQFQSTGAAIGQYQAVVLVQSSGNWQEFARDNFEITRPATDVRMSIEVQRDARVLILLSCSQAQASGFATGGGLTAAEHCEAARKAFLQAYLDARGISHKIVLTQADFMRELRCGRYNVFWLSGGAVKLGVAQTKELREAIFRGEGFIQEGNHDQRNSQVDEMLGFVYRGHQASENLVHRGAGSLFPQVDLPSYGRSLKYELTMGRLEGSFVATQTPAMISSVYGQGRALTYAFDLVESLKRNGTEPAVERLLNNGLMHVTPTASTPEFAMGAYVPVTTTVENLGPAVDLRLQSSVPAPAVIESSAPTPTAATALSSTWDFNLPEAQSRTFDANVRLPQTQTNTSFRSELWSRRNGQLEALSNQTLQLTVVNAELAKNATLDALRNAVLNVAEDSAARDKAVRDIDAAWSALQNRQVETAIGKWMDAIDSLRKIKAVSIDAWRLALSRLLQYTEQQACLMGAGLCANVPAAPTRFDDATFANLNGGKAIMVARGGGDADWEWSLAADAEASPSTQINLDWQRNRAIRFVANLNRDGSASLELFDGTTRLASSNFAAGTTPIRLGSALQFVVRNTEGLTPNQTIKLSQIKLQGLDLLDNLISAQDGQQDSASLSVYWPRLSEGGVVEGLVNLDYTGRAPPQGSGLQLEMHLGGLQCNGGVQ